MAAETTSNPLEPASTRGRPTEHGSRRSLLPKEHGAYAQLGLPLVAALAAGRPTLASLGFVGAACAAFLAHEPLLIVLGQRGTRAAREDGARAKRRLVITATASASLGVFALVLSAVSRPLALVSVVLGIAALVVVGLRKERTLGGELVASAAMTSTALPVAVASGLATDSALALCAVFYASTVVSTVEVRSIVRREGTAASRVVGWAVAAGTIVALWLTKPPFVLAVLPTLAVLAVAAVSRLRPAQLRKVGWTLATASVLGAALVVVAARSAP